MPITRLNAEEEALARAERAARRAGCHSETKTGGVSLTPTTTPVTTAPPMTRVGQHALVYSELPASPVEQQPPLNDSNMLRREVLAKETLKSAPLPPKTSVLFTIPATKAAPILDTTRTMRPASHTSSNTALRMQREERLAEVAKLQRRAEALRRKMEMEAELARIEDEVAEAQLASRLEDIEVEGSQAGSQDIQERVEDWLNRHPTVGPSTAPPHEGDDTLVAPPRVPITTLVELAQCRAPPIWTTAKHLVPTMSTTAAYQSAPCGADPVWRAIQSTGMPIAAPPLQSQPSVMPTTYFQPTYSMPPTLSQLPTTPKRESQAQPIPGTPGREKTGTKQAIQELAEAIGEMARSRPPPRQIFELPHFTGGWGEWLAFEAAYYQSTAAHKFSPVDNLARLRVCIRGAARDMIAPQLYTVRDPEELMATLRQCYGQPDVIANEALATLRKLPKLTASPTPTELNNFSVRVQNVISVLMAIQQSGYLHNPLLNQEILERLTPHLRSRYYDFATEKRSPTDPPILTMSRFLVHEASRALCHGFTGGVPITTAKPEKKTLATKVVSRQPPRPTVTFEATRPIFNTISEEGCCLCCGKNHTTPQCTKFLAMDVSARWDWAREQHVCYRCLASRHRRERCRARNCKIAGCRRQHHTLLHTDPPQVKPPEIAETSQTPPTPPTQASAAQSPEEHRISATRAAQDRVLLKLCPVTIRGPRGSVNTFALLDDGSTVTLVDADLTEEIGATGSIAPLKMMGVGGSTIQEASQRVKIEVQGDGTAHCITARTVRPLSLGRQTLATNVAAYSHLRDLQAACYTDAVPRLLIGGDNWDLLLAHEVRTGKKSEPAAVRTDLGWTIFGSVPKKMTRATNGEIIMFTRAAELHDYELHDAVKTHFAIDALGVSLAVKRRPADKRAEEIFENTVTHHGDHYEVGLPWKEDNAAMPATYHMALSRLINQEKKMNRDPAFAVQYVAQIENLIKKGYAVPANPRELQHPRAWVLPHFAVRNPNKPAKLRVVFDAAAKVGNKSLNDYLLEGPDLLQSLPGILYRFREGPYAVTADIEEMFLRVKIRDEDQPAQLFLWRTIDAKKSPPTLYKMTSMLFGATSSPFLAHSVRNYNALKHAKEFPQAVAAITTSHYMDDFADSFTTEEELIITAEQVNLAHKRAGFYLRSWNTNSPTLRRLIAPHLLANKPAHLGPADNKILGLYWDPQTDELGFNTSMTRVPAEVKQRKRAPTKREALSAVMSIYDPLGLLSPFTISAKITLQNLWRQKLQWDEPIPDDEASQIHDWLCGLNDVAALRIPRCYETGGEEEDRELHIFVDSSEVAYAAVAYWRTTADDESKMMLLAGKAKVAPLKQLSVPRLELQAALIGARLAAHIKKEHRLRVTREIYWTDSRTVLSWIRDDARRFSTYVAHRLGEIAELTRPDQWRWVPTTENVADDATRPGANRPHISDRWFTGPGFLQQKQSAWPEERDTILVRDEETRTFATRATNLKPPLPDVSRFSNFERLVRATARILQAIDTLRGRGRGLCLQHIERAEVLLLQSSQQDAFQTEIHTVEEGRPLSSSSRLYKLDPVVNDGLLRMRGRIDAAPIPQATKTPIILDGRHPVTRLLVLQAHHRANHSTTERVVNDLRQRYWIVKLRPTVRTVAQTCQECRIRKAKPQPPAAGNLPQARISPYHRAFTYSGVDYFGPLQVTIGRRHEKRWVALFTCLSTRAVHLEIVHSLSTDSAIMALRRMAARRGWPRIIYSDNATCFHGADKELHAACNDWQPSLAEYAQLHRTEWRFIPPGAPNQGGAWERLVRNVKSALNTTLRNKAPKEEIFKTVLAEAEYTVNARPLTHVSTDPDDSEALTPNHFLLGSSAGLPTTGPCEEADKRTWRAAQALADHFWTRWVREYLPTLAPRGSPSGSSRPLKIGDLVIVADATLPRNTWPRGEVIAVHPGPDGAVRSASVRTRGGIFLRPTSKLAVLRVEATPAPTQD